MALLRRNAGLTLTIALLALLAGGKAILYDTLDPDCFWHLRVAEQLHRDGIGPVVDDMSFSSIKAPWTPYSWLAELGMKLIWDVGGYRGAIATQAILMGVVIALIAMASHELVRRGRENNDAGNSLAVIIATVFAMFFSLPYLSFRPVTFAIVLLALCSWLILRDRRLEQRSRAVWIIVPLTALITNCHFYAIMVPLWIGALLVGAIGERSKREIVRYAAMTFASLCACAATPMLPGMVRAVWSYQFADPMVGGGVIAEFQPLWTSAITMLIVLTWLAFAIRNRNRLRLGEWLWMIGSLVLFVRLGRFAPIFAMIAAPTLAASLPQFGNRVLLRPTIRLGIASVIVVGLIRLSLSFPRPDMSLGIWLNRNGPDTPGYPAAAADFVDSSVQPSFGRIINEFSWGGYLAWRLGEHYQVLLDGRTQLYSPDFWRAMYLDHPEASRAVLEASRADVAILPVQQSRFRPTLLEMGWTTVYRDDRAEVLLPPETAVGLSE